ncbi:MAG: hypothetical protein KDE28_24915, partial [Anaerolineales bacterium]|nr:hypothetical protein [Anaerolineales bacterium]
MRPPTLERSDPLQLGVQLATDPVNLPDFVFDDLERLQPQILKINHNEWPEKIGQLAIKLPERNWIIETRPGRGGAAPNDYVREIMPDLDKLLQELTSRSVGSIALEIQPEPYGELGSLSRLSTDPYELGRWWRAVVEQLREILPQQIIYLFPNLADQLNPRGGRELSAQNMRSFLSEMGEFLYGIDGVAVGFEFVTEQLSGGDLLNYAHTLLTSYSNLGVPLWLTHVWAELVNVPAGGQPQLYRDLLDMIEKEFPLVHGVVFFPFYSLRDQFKETTWAGSPALRQLTALMRRQPLPALPEEPAGYIWLGGAQQLSDGRWQTVTQVTV